MQKEIKFNKKCPFCNRLMAENNNFCSMRCKKNFDAALNKK